MGRVVEQAMRAQLTGRHNLTIAFGGNTASEFKVFQADRISYQISNQVRDHNQISRTKVNCVTYRTGLKLFLILDQML